MSSPIIPSAEIRTPHTTWAHHLYHPHAAIPAASPASDLLRSNQTCGWKPDRGARERTSSDCALCCISEMGPVSAWSSYLCRSPQNCVSWLSVQLRYKMIDFMRQKYQKHSKITDYFRIIKKISPTRPATVDLVAKQDEASGNPRSLQTQRSNPSAHHQEEGPPGLTSKDTSRGRPNTTGRVAGKSKASLSRSRSITVTNFITLITKIRDEGYEQYPGTEVRAQTRLDPLGYEKFLERLDQPRNRDLRNYMNHQLR